MKTIFLFCFLFFISLLCLSGQICTPKGTSIDYSDPPVGSTTDLATWESDAASWVAAYLGQHPGKYINRIGAADGSYNCHAYAWHVSQGGYQDWLTAYLTSDYNNFNPDNQNSTPPQPNNIKKYWNDGSYVEVSESQGQKVWYGTCWEWSAPGYPGKWTDLCDHSAIITTTVGRYKSKWGKWPLYEHDFDACPYKSSNRKYYKLDFSISGDFLLCTSNKSYTLGNSPVGTITWTTSPTGYISPSNGNGNPAQIHASSGSVSGYSTILFTLTTCGNATYQFTSNPFWVGKFESTYVTGQAAVCPDRLYTYTALVPGGHLPSYSYTWTYPSNWSINWQNQNLIRLYTPRYNPAYGTVRVAVTNQCGTSGYSGITVYPAGGCGGYFSFYPNPASEIISVNMNVPEMPMEAKDSVTYNADLVMQASQTYKIRIYDNQGNLKSSISRTGLNFEVPLNNLNDGLYILEVCDSRSCYRQQLILKHN